MNTGGEASQPFSLVFMAILSSSSRARADQPFKLGNDIWRGTDILPVFFAEGQDARATIYGR